MGAGTLYEETEKSYLPSGSEPVHDVIREFRFVFGVQGWGEIPG
jgi:hypothetical protein